MKMKVVSNIAHFHLKKMTMLLKMLQITHPKSKWLTIIFLDKI